MSAEQGLERAERRLTELCKLLSIPQNADAEKEIQDCLETFLSVSVSVPEYLLHDFNLKFGLNIPLTEKRFRHEFQSKAKRTGNQTALQFICWWGKQMDLLRKDPIGGLLIGKRHIARHRTQVILDLTKIAVRLTISVPKISYKVEVFQGGKLLETSRSAEQPAPSPKKTEITSGRFFSEHPDESIVTVCEKFLAKLANFVSTAEQKFP